MVQILNNCSFFLAATGNVKKWEKNQSLQVPENVITGSADNSRNHLYQSTIWETRICSLKIELEQNYNWPVSIYTERQDLLE